MSQVVITEVSKHGKTVTGQLGPNNQPIKQTRVGHSMFTVVTGYGSKRKSTTVHGTRQMAELVANQQTVSLIFKLASTKNK